MLEFYFRFRLSRLRHHRHVILHLPIKFRPNRTTRDVVMTSYTFFKMAATDTDISPTFGMQVDFDFLK